MTTSRRTDTKISARGPMPLRRPLVANENCNLKFNPQRAVIGRETDIVRRYLVAQPSHRMEGSFLPVFGVVWSRRVGCKSRCMSASAGKRLIRCAAPQWREVPKADTCLWNNYQRATCPLSLSAAACNSASLGLSDFPFTAQSGQQRLIFPTEFLASGASYCFELRQA